MWSYHPELLSVPVPRYTSYPTAAEFREDVGPVDLISAVEGTSGDVSLYVHIPFCEKICWYCGCNTSAANRTERVARYLDALHNEIALIGARLPGTARVTQIAFGGGSPNSIKAVDFVRLVDALTVQFRVAHPAMSIEVDPRSLRGEWAAVIRAVGIVRASLGVQTFSPALQRAIGRLQPEETIREVVTSLRGAGVRSLNFDLMYGLPGQTLQHVEDSLRRSIEFGADRIAFFGYAHVPHLIPRQGRIDAALLPDMRARFDMAAFGHDMLVAEGYVAVGFDHFARPGDPLAQAAIAGRLRRNFQGFTEDQAATVIGFGASAISSFPELLVQNEKNTGRYGMMLSQDRLPAVRGVRRSAEDRRLGALIEALLCRGRGRVTLPLDRPTLAALMPYVAAGLCTVDGDDLVLSADCQPYARSIAAHFDPYRSDSLRRFSSAI